MALRTARFRPGGRPDRRQNGGFAGLMVLIVLGVALWGCSPIETWRSLSGVSKNDPDPKTRLLAAAPTRPFFQDTKVKNQSNLVSRKSKKKICLLPSERNTELFGPFSPP